MDFKIDLDVTLMDGTHLSFNGIQERGLGYIMLDDAYTLTGNYKLYKVKGNVLCGEEIEYKEISVKITK